MQMDGASWLEAAAFFHGMFMELYRYLHGNIGIFTGIS